jgi:cyclohexyl-isocyanide hydratase
MLVYPGMTALDLIGPQQVFGHTMGMKVHLIWKSKEPVTSDTGVKFLPAMTFEECPAAHDIMFLTSLRPGMRLAARVRKRGGDYILEALPGRPPAPAATR